MNNIRIKNSRRKGIMIKYSFFLYLSLCLFATVWLKTKVVSLEYELGEMDRLRSDMIREKKMVAAMKASFYSTEKIEKVAVRKLNMTLPDRESVFFVKRVRDAGPVRTSMK